LRRQGRFVDLQQGGHRGFAIAAVARRRGAL
jgi:hypothetical protein